MTREIIELDERRERRRHIALAHASEDWQEIKASFAIEGMTLDENNAEIIGRMIAGEMTLREAQSVIRLRLHVGELMRQPEDSPKDCTRCQTRPLSKLPRSSD